MWLVAGGWWLVIRFSFLVSRWGGVVFWLLVAGFWFLVGRGGLGVRGGFGVVGFVPADFDWWFCGGVGVPGGFLGSGSRRVPVGIRCERGMGGIWRPGRRRRNLAG